MPAPLVVISQSIESTNVAPDDDSAETSTVDGAPGFGKRMEGLATA